MLLVMGVPLISHTRLVLSSLVVTNNAKDTIFFRK